MYPRESSRQGRSDPLITRRSENRTYSNKPSSLHESHYSAQPHLSHLSIPVIEPQLDAATIQNGQSLSNRRLSTPTLPSSEEVANELIAALENDLFNVRPSDDETKELSANARASINPHAVWQVALSQLEMQLPPSTFNTWVRDTQVLAYEDGEFIICATNAYACDWLQNRLRPMIKRTLTAILKRGVQVQFQVQSHPVQDRPDAASLPLYQELNEVDTTPNQPTSLLNDKNEKARASSVETIAAVDPVPAEADEKPSAMVVAPASSSSTPYARQPLSQTGLNPILTFATFVVGNHNRLASAAAESVTEKPGRSFNPLFVYGGTGLGKTHLLHAIGNQLQQRGHRVLYCTSEQFTIDLISAIRHQTTHEFRNKYRAVDVLMIDDIQFISGKDSTQEEFFHTFNHLHSVGKQVVLSSDRLPKAVPTLEERLRSRFEGGLQVDISQPDFETRVAILANKAQQRNLPFGFEVLKEIASRVDSNVRELEGALNHLALRSQMVDGPMDIPSARALLDNLAPSRTPCPPIKLIDLVARYYRLSANDLIGERRTKPLVHARHIAMYLLRTLNNLSLPQIGDQIGGRDHTTVGHGVEKIEQQLTEDELLRNDITALREQIYGHLSA